MKTKKIFQSDVSNLMAEFFLMSDTNVFTVKDICRYFDDKGETTKTVTIANRISDLFIYHNYLFERKEGNKRNYIYTLKSRRKMAKFLYTLPRKQPRTPDKNKPVPINKEQALALKLLTLPTGNKLYQESRYLV